ncbi:MAG TPA: PQQ-dependent sugar dehydrogenase [Saprospiraceae bacterium]|nr:PQQ-dependent sugar dehydrogenase [Saprospiraceae bacterium]
MRTSQKTLSFFFLLLFSCSIQAQIPTDFNDYVYANGYVFPTAIEFDQNAQLYIASKPGRIYVIDSSGAKVREPLLDISEEVADWSDHGLMDFALDPDFLNNGYIYLLYAVDPHHWKYYGTPQYDPRAKELNTATIGRVTRYQADAATQFTSLVPDSRKVLLGESIDNAIPLIYEFHGLGSLLAAKDGTLLVSCGDATLNVGAAVIGKDTVGSLTHQALQEGIITADMDIGAYRAQYPGIYSGKVLRIDAQTGDGLASNPYYDPDAPRAPQSRIWAMGFRNPYRISLKPETGSHYQADGDPGTIFVGDVGNGAWEELNIITKGGQNFGWPIVEGIKTSWSFWTKEVPLNQAAPNPLAQAGACEQVFFNFRDLLVRSQKQPQLPTNPCNSAQIVPEDYLSYEKLPVIAWSNSRWNKPERAIVPVFNPEDGKPEEVETTAPESPVESEAFGGFSSLAGVYYDSGTYPEKYHHTYFGLDFSGWIKCFRFDDKLNLLSVEPFHNGVKDIIHLISHPQSGELFYINLAGEIRTISYGGNPPPQAVIEADRSFGAGPLTVKFDASSSSDSNLPITQYFWDFGDGTSSTEISPSHTFQASGPAPEGFAVRLTVTDSLGAEASTETVISLNNTPPEVDIISFEDGDQYPIDATALLRLEARVEDAEHGPEELQYEWRIFLHHNDHFHPEPAIYEPETFTLISPLGCIDELYWYRIELTVTDGAGLQTRLTERIYPYCGEPFWKSTELEASVLEKEIELNWQSQEEEGLDRILIQRSKDLFHFETIGELNTTGAGSTYRFVDRSPMRGSNLYRLKLRNQEGVFRYSNVATATYPRPLAVQVQPNPAREFFDLRIKKTEGETLRFTLYDVSGRKLLDSSWNTPTGIAFEKRIYTNQLSNGTYLYQVHNGELRGAGKVVVSK